MSTNVVQRANRATIDRRGEGGSASMPLILGVSTATPPSAYSQREIVRLLGIRDTRIESIFLNGGIKRRHLSVPRTVNGLPRNESQADLLERHKRCGVELATRAINRALSKTNAGVKDIRYLCCVTSTGFLTPGLSALLCHELKIRPDCTRLDIVGMGCSAGLCGMNATATWAQSHPGELGLTVCVEVCSAAYVSTSSIQNAVVNSLFGDGAAAVSISTDARHNCDARHPVPSVLKFASFLIPESLHAMGYCWDSIKGKFRFFLDRDIPYVIGAHVEEAVRGLLADTTISRSDVAHWIVHSGGKKVIDALRANLLLTAYDLRHTIGALRDYGNVSSGAFLFSLEKLLDEGCAKRGEHGVMIAMGPGASIEAALIRW